MNWKSLSILGFSDYEICQEGIVRNIHTKKELKLEISTMGRKRVDLIDDRGRVHYEIPLSRLFKLLGQNKPYSKEYHIFLDGNPDNYSEDNIKKVSNIGDINSSNHRQKHIKNLMSLFE